MQPYLMRAKYLISQYWKKKRKKKNHGWYFIRKIALTHNLNEWTNFHNWMKLIINSLNENVWILMRSHYIIFKNLLYAYYKWILKKYLCSINTHNKYIN
jgi:hypothetical protein